MLRPQKISGKLAYLHDAGGSWGREEFSMSIGENGRFIRALSEMDNVKLLRDTTWSLAPDWTPREGYFRVVDHGATKGSGWCRVDGATVDYEGLTAEKGRVSQQVKADGPIQFLGFHAMVGDALIGAARGCDERGVEKPLVCVTNSFAAYGDEGLTALIGRPMVTYAGRESISVPAGVFDTEHFIVRWSDVMPKPSHFFVLPEHYLPVRMTGALGPVHYELIELMVE